MVMFNCFLLNKDNTDDSAQSKIQNPKSKIPQIPFKDVFIHAMIQDGDGRKMSKSLGNGVDPLDIISSHGADAMRFTLAGMVTHTQDVRLPVERDPATGRNTSAKFDAGRNFCNKLWNAARFVFSQVTNDAATSGVATSVTLTLADRWILSRLNRTIREADDAINAYRFDQYAKTTYDFFWRDFCDWYLEIAKSQMKNPATRESTGKLLMAVLDASLRLLHPVIPFVTEKVWWQLNDIAPDRSIKGVIELAPAKRCIRAKWLSAGAVDESAEAIMDNLQVLITAIRTIRNDYKVSPKQVVPVTIVAPECGQQIELNREVIETLAMCKLSGVVNEMTTPPANSTKAPAGACEVYVEGLIDPAAEFERVNKRRDELVKSIAALKGRLSNQGYLAKAPPNLVKQTQDQLADAEAELAKLG